MADQAVSYNESEAIQFIHGNISEPLRKKYDTDDLAYILDFVYEYYESIENEQSEGDTVNLPEMLEFVNKSMEQSNLKLLEEKELEEVLVADNDYMDSIGLGDEDEANADVVNLDEIVEDVYKQLPADIQKKYGIEDVYLLLCLEADYINENDFVNEEELLTYVVSAAEEEELEVDAKTLEIIFSVEAKLLGEE